MAEPKHFLYLDQVDPKTLRQILDRGKAMKKQRANGGHDKPLAGKTLAMIFEKPSTRTRVSFEVGMRELGGQTIMLGRTDTQLGRGETIADTARVLASYLDVLVARTYDSDAEMRELAGQDRMAVVNAMSESEHPTQAIADLSTLQEALGRLAGVHVLFLGEGNNTAASLALAVAKVPEMRLTLVTPEGYGLPAGILAQAERAAAEHGASIAEHHCLEHLPCEVDAVYTTRWLTMGVQKPDADWLSRFRPYTVTPDIMKRVSKPAGTIFLHDLPAMRGYEVLDEVLDGGQSVAFRQAFHKMTSAMAVLAWCATPS